MKKNKLEPCILSTIKTQAVYTINNQVFIKKETYKEPII